MRIIDKVWLANNPVRKVFVVRPDRDAKGATWNVVSTSYEGHTIVSAIVAQEFELAGCFRTKGEADRFVERNFDLARVKKEYA